MNLEEFSKLYKFLMENHSWKSMFDDYVEGRNRQCRRPKYFVVNIDTRTGEFWSITFNPGSPEPEKRSFRLDDKEDLEAMYKWLVDGNESD